MNPVTREELAAVIERAERSENLARRRSPQPSVLVEYFRERQRQMKQVEKLLKEKHWKERAKL